MGDKLPPELISLIIEDTGDWELAQTLGIHTRLKETTPWIEQATSLDRGILTGSLRLCKEQVSSGHYIFTQWGARVMIRFGYIHLLDYFHATLPRLLQVHCRELLPSIASAWGRTTVLEWASLNNVGIDGTADSAMDEASRHGHVEILEWWRRSRRVLCYSENALNHATVKHQIPVLEWWKKSGLPLKLGNVMDFASMEGTTELLDWWAQSGLECQYTMASLYHLSSKGNVKGLDWWKKSGFPLLYDKEVLMVATKCGKVQSLEWWYENALPVEFKYFDVEVALEDLEINREATQNWWTSWWEKEGGGATLDNKESMRNRILRCGSDLPSVKKENKKL